MNWRAAMLAQPRNAAAAGAAAEEAAATAASEPADWTRDRANGTPSAGHVRHLPGRRAIAYL